tara:strand:- start:38095 stop:39033 length:939 start_codon:yes stop_codon:yes gene_type:complete
MGTTRQSIDELEKLAKTVKDKFASIPDGEKVRKAGMGGNKKVEPIPNFVAADCEKVIQGESNTWIVFGRDRPQSKSSGQMLIGASHAGSIDICAGRAATEARETTENGEPVFFNNDFKADATRIYISQKTSIDRNFGLVPGRVGNYNGQSARSAIGMKADNLRFIARNGIKLVTRTDDTNSRDGDVNETRGIDIIAGNDDSDLQQMVKGNNLNDLLILICDDIRIIAQSLHLSLLNQMAVNSVLAAHTHTDPATGLTGPSIEAGVVMGLDAHKKVIQDLPDTIIEIINSIVMELTFLKPGGKHILSKHNHVN